MPSQLDFFAELLDPRPLLTTDKFNSYERDSYFADKLEIWRGLPSYAQQRGRALRALVIYGPARPIWAYYVFVFLDEGTDVRVNEVVFPHARLTWKGTQLLATADAEQWLEKLKALPNVERVDAATPDGLDAALPKADEGARDFRFSMLLVHRSFASTVHIAYDAQRDPSKVAAIEEHLNALADRLTETYPSALDTKE